MVRTNSDAEYTLSLLSKLSSLANSKQLYIHLWSCYGGAANKEADKLSSGSIFVTHISENNPSLSAFTSYALTQSFSKSRSSDHFAELAKDILVNSMQPSTININNGNYIAQLGFAINFDLTELISNPRKLISEKLESLKKQAEVQNIKFVSPTFPDDEIHNFVKGYIIQQASIGSSELKFFLQNPHISEEELKILLNDNPFKYSSLQEASDNGDVELVELLIKAGANLNFVDKNGVTALFQAAQNGDKEVVQLLIKAGADLDIARNVGATALHAAICLDKDIIAEMLFNKHMEIERNVETLIEKTSKIIKKFCPSELDDFQALVANYELEYAHTEL